MRSPLRLAGGERFVDSRNALGLVDLVIADIDVGLTSADLEPGASPEGIANGLDRYINDVLKMRPEDVDVSFRVGRMNSISSEFTTVTIHQVWDGIELVAGEVVFLIRRSDGHVAAVSGTIHAPEPVLLPESISPPPEDATDLAIRVNPFTGRVEAHYRV